MRNDVVDISELAQRLLTSFEAKDMSAILDCFASDAVMIDPHYPQVRMEGKVAIMQGISWTFSSMIKPSFTIKHVWPDEQSVAIEVDTHHLFKGGMVIDVPQTFVMETREGLITRLQSYPSYTPHGIAGLMIRLTGLLWRMQGKLK